jgi:hypothetical protein
VTWLIVLWFKFTFVVVLSRSGDDVIDSSEDGDERDGDAIDRGAEVEQKTLRDVTLQ